MMKFIGTFSGKDPIRPAMSFVQVKEGSIVATDANKLIRIIDGSTLNEDKLVCESRVCKDNNPEDQKFPNWTPIVNSFDGQFSESYDMVDLYEALMQVRNDDLKNKVSKTLRVIELKLENVTIYFNITLLLQCVKGCLLLGWKKAFISYSSAEYKAVVFTEETVQGRLSSVSLIMLMPIFGSDDFEKVTITPKVLLEQGGMMADGGEVVIPTTNLNYNPDYLVGTNTMYEMFADGGMMAQSGNQPEIRWDSVENAIINFLKANTKILDKRVQAKDTEGTINGLNSIIDGLTNAQKNLNLKFISTSSSKMADGGMMAKGGAIENQYEGRTPKDIWNNLTEDQKYHFVNDHELQIEMLKDENYDYNSDKFPKEISTDFVSKSIRSEWKDLDEVVQNRFANHVRQGEYADGGMMAKGGKIREFDDVLIISKNKLGMVEAIADNIYYITTPFGESFEAALDDLKKVVSFAPGGSLQGHGFEVGDRIAEDLGGYIRVVSEDGKDYFIKLRDGDRLTEPPLPFKHGGKVKHSDVTRLATKTNETGDEVVDLTEFYEGGGNVPKLLDVPAQFLDAEGKRKNDRKTIKELTDFVLALPQTKEIYYNDELGDYTPSRKKLHAEIINKFKKEVVCINNDQPIAIFMGGSPASGKSSFLRKYSPFLLKEEILKVDADEVRAMLPEYEGWNAAQTHLETRDIVNILLSNKNIGIPCDFDIIYDGTMNSVKSYLPLMDILRKRGYKIFIVYMDNVPKDVIIKRALERYKTSGRFVPLEVIEDFFSKGKTAFNELKKDVDGYMLIDGSSRDYNVIEEGGIKLPRDREYSKLGTKIKASDIPVSYKKGGLSLLY
jgi:predicted ABC-type ATPase